MKKLELSSILFMLAALALLLAGVTTKSLLIFAVAVPIAAIAATVKLIDSRLKQTTDI